MSITLQFVLEIDEVATDVTSAVLSDPTGTYGVKRNDNDGTVVADGTAMSKVDTGTYEYSFDPPADGLDYTYCVEYVYDGQTYRDEHTYSDATKVVSLVEVKSHLRIDGTDDDVLLNTLIDAATEYGQECQSRKYLTATCVDYLDAWPRVIRPRYSPLLAVTSIQYVDINGDTQTWSSDEYDVDTDREPGRIQPAYNQLYPNVRRQMNAITLTYTAGYGTSADDVPSRIRQALLMLIGHWYENRESTIVAVPITPVPLGVSTLLSLDRVRRV